MTDAWKPVDSICLFLFKLIVATNEEQDKRLDNLYERGIKNNVRDLKILVGDEIKKIEPNCVVRCQAQLSSEDMLRTHST